MATVAVGIVWAVDLATGSELSLSLFYLLPISLAAWFVGKREAILFSVASAGLWLAADHLGGATYSQPLIPIWNALVRLGFFLIVTFILAALRRVQLAQEELARLDGLTGMPNLRHFSDVAEVELSRAARHGHPISVAFFDLDDFKAVNDQLGHQQGDALLRAVATAILGNVRLSDLAGRLGGDEFALLMPETSEGAAATVVEKLRSAVRSATKEAGFQVSVSVGCFTFLTPPDSVNEMLRKADRLMYEVKRAGKDSLLSETGEATVATTVRDNGFAPARRRPTGLDSPRRLP